MPGRYIREGILTSEKIDVLSESAEVFYRRLLNVVDDYGRYYANVLQLFCNCYPLKLHTLNEREQLLFQKKIRKSLGECQKVGLIAIYGENKYLQIVNFGQKARAQKSKFPEPKTNEINDCKTIAKQMQNDCKTNVKQLLTLNDNVNDNVNDNSNAQNDKIVPRSKRIKFNYETSTLEGVKECDIQEWKKAYPAVDIKQEILKAKQWLIDNPAKRKKNVSRFITNWLSRKQERGGTVTLTENEVYDYMETYSREHNDIFGKTPDIIGEHVNKIYARHKSNPNWQSEVAVYASNLKLYSK